MKRFLVRSLVVAIALAISSSAQAAFTVTFSNGVNPNIVVTDGGLSDIDGAVNGTIVYSNASLFGQYNLTLFTATANAPGGGITVGGQFGAQVTQQTLSITGLVASPNALSITTTPDPYTFGGNNVYTVTNAFGSSGVATGATATATTTISPGGTTPVATIIGTGIPSGDQSTTGNFASSNPFTLSNLVVLNGLSTGRQAQLTLNSTAVVAVPAPSALLLLGLGIPALGLVRRWTRKNTMQLATA
jgi:hypothetical protein